MSGDSMLQKIRDEFFGNSLTMIDFLGQFELMARKYFEPDRIYDLYRLCLVKRRVLDGGEREVLQFLNDRLELIEELTLGKKSSEQLVVNEFLSMGDSDSSGGEPDVSPLMQDFFDRVISVSSSESITRRTGGLSKILLDGETRTETYTDRPDIPLFEESEDGFQKVHPVSKAFKEDDDIPLITPFSEEPDLFSDLGLHPEKEEDKEQKENLPLNEEPEVIFTHSSIVIDEGEDDEEDYSVFEGGIKVTPPDEEEIVESGAGDESLEEFIESLVEEFPEEQAVSEVEPSFESETIPEEMSVPEEELPVEELPAYEPVPGSDHFEVVDEASEEPLGTPELVETLPEPAEESEDIPELPELPEPFAAQETTELESEPEPPHRKQRISIFDDIDEEPEPPVADEEPESVVSEEETAPAAPQEETDAIEPVEFDTEPVLLTEDDLILPEDQEVPVREEEVAEEATDEEPEAVVPDEVAEEPVEDVSEEIAEEPAEVEAEEPAEEPEAVITEEITEDAETVESEIIAEEPETAQAEVTTGSVAAVAEEEEAPLLFDEHFFDDVEEPEPAKETVDETPEIEEAVEETAVIDETVEEAIQEAVSTVVDEEPAPAEEKQESEEVFHHISRDEIVSSQPESEAVEVPAETHPIEAAVPEPVETITQPVAEAYAGTKEEEKTMAGEEEKSTFSVLVKMLIVLGLIIATWFILDATGLLKGKAASTTGVDLAKGAVVITDSNSLADKREYPFNRDTQNDGNLKGTIFKDGKYYEVAENGVLTPVEYDTSSAKKIKVTVPPDSLLAKDTKKDKKGDKKGKEKEKEKDKTTQAGNITLQDAVKNKVKETKIADHVFKSGKKFFVQISAHRSFDTAEKIALDLKKKGYNSFVMKVKKDGVRGEDGVWYRVRIGPYDKEAKALEVNKVFNKNKKS